MRKRINYCERTRNDPTPTYVGSYALRPNIWIEGVYWSFWFEDALRLAGYNYLRRNKRPPQTLAGLRALKTDYDFVCRQGIENGGIQPGGRVTTEVAAEIRETTGNLDFDGILPAGFLIHAGSLTNQSREDHVNRDAPPFRGWAVGTQAIHKSSLRLVFI